MTALLTISYSRRRPAQRISLKAGNWQLRSPPNTRHLKAVGVLRAVEQPGGDVAGQHGCVGVAMQGLPAVGAADLEAAAGVQSIPLDALIRQRAVGGRAALRGLVQACVAEEFFCAQVACVVAVAVSDSASYQATCFDENAHLEQHSFRNLRPPSVSLYQGRASISLAETLNISSVTNCVINSSAFTSPPKPALDNATSKLYQVTPFGRFSTKPSIKIFISREIMAHPYDIADLVSSFR